jgi:glucosamine kinase
MGDTLELISQFASTNQDAFESVCIGMSGFASLGIDVDAMASRINQLLAVKNVLMASDMVTGHYSHFEEQAGTTLIAGTGSLAFGVGPKGIFRVDGLGATVGDFGSGYWIGREAIRAAKREAEISGLDPLIRDLETELGSASNWPLRFGRGEIDTAAVAKLAPIIFKNAAAESKVAIDVVARASKHLAESAKAAAHKSGTVTVAYGGGLFTSNSRLLDETFALEAQAAGLQLEKMTNPPGLGAAKIAQRATSSRIEELVEAGHLVRKQF